MTHLDLFSGIGGFALAVDAVWDNAEHIFCEINPYCQQLLKLRFKGAKIYGDIRELTGEKICQELAQNVMRERLRSTDRIVNVAMPNVCEIGETKTENVIEPQQGNGVKKESFRSSHIMAESAFVVEKNKSSFLPSTTNTITEITKEDYTNHKLGSSLSNEGIRKITKSSATTVITQRRITENAHIKNEVQIDLLTAGVPCQPASQAGKRAGTKDDRWLWPETFRVIKETEPRFVILENVRGILTLEGGLVFESLLAEMENLGYETRTYIIPAVAVNAPHRRDRVWFVAHAKSEHYRGNAGELPQTNEQQASERQEERLCESTNASGGHTPDTKSTRQPCGIDRQGEEQFWRSDKQPEWDANWLEVATSTCNVRVDDGLPAELDGFKLSKAGHRVERLKALGNAIVPQVAIEIMRAIALSEEVMAL